MIKICVVLLVIKKKKRKRKTTYTTYCRSRYCVVDDLMELVVFLTYTFLRIIFFFFLLYHVWNQYQMNSKNQKMAVHHWRTDSILYTQVSRIYTTLCSNFIVRFFNRSIILFRYFLYIYILYISHTRLYFTIMAAKNLLF